MSVEMAKGVEPDGIAYCIRLDADIWRATVEAADGRRLEETFPMSYPPVCGPDAGDIALGEHVLERLIHRLRTP